MDSGNSGSMSSSGGDDQELDIVSRSESVSGFMNSHHPSLQFGGSSDNNSDPNLFSQYQNHHHHHQPNTLFDLSSNYLQALSQSQSPNSSNPNFLLNLRSDHQPNSTTATRSDEPNCTNPMANLPGSSSSAHQGPSILGTPRSNYTSAKPNNLVRSSKKRTRASRRAPTTVLTTDTSNFRAMVQEFTGIPAPPFSAGSSSYSRRLDSIFGSGSIYPLRPSAQKVQQTPFLSSSSSLLMSNCTSMVDATNIATSTSNDMNNFNFTHQGLIAKQLPHHHNMMLNMQNPIHSAFQSSLPHHHEQQQQPPPFHSSSINFGAKPNRESTTLPLHSLEDQLGMTMSHGYLNTNLGGSDGSITMLPLRSDDDHDVRWRDHGGLGSGAGSDGRGVLDHDHHLRPNLDHGIINSSRSNTRGGEATVDSWICPSD